MNPEELAAFEKDTDRIVQAAKAAQSAQQPSVARVVHYLSRGSADGVFEPQCRAAIITEVVNAEEQFVSLCVLNPTGMYFDELLEYDETATIGGTWHWPERV